LDKTKVRWERQENIELVGKNENDEAVTRNTFCVCSTMQC